MLLFPPSCSLPLSLEFSILHVIAASDADSIITFHKPVLWSVISASSEWRWVDRASLMQPFCFAAESWITVLGTCLHPAWCRLTQAHSSARLGNAGGVCVETLAKRLNSSYRAQPYTDFGGMLYIPSFQLTPVPHSLPGAAFVLCPGCSATAWVCGAPGRAGGKSCFPS